MELDRSDPLVQWLLDADPALQWQIERDLLGEADAIWQASRARTASEGYGRELLSRQGSDGLWDGGAFFPAGWQWDSDEPQPWTATTWALNDLRTWGVPASALGDTAARLAAHTRWEYDDLPYWGGEVDVCINAFTLSNGLWLDADVDGLVDWFLAHQQADDGWNCEWVDGSKRGSFHSTLNALIALLDYRVATGDAARVAEARRRGEEYLLSRDLYKRLSTGRPFGEHWNSLAHPRRAYYNVLAAADYFRAATIADGTEPDARLGETIAEIRRQQQPDGRWLQGHRLAGKVWFHQDAPTGEPSRWVTLHALRVLDWWDCAIRPR